MLDWISDLQQQLRNSGVTSADKTTSSFEQTASNFMSTSNGLTGFLSFLVVGSLTLPEIGVADSLLPQRLRPLPEWAYIPNFVLLEVVESETPFLEDPYEEVRPGVLSPKTVTSRITLRVADSIRRSFEGGERPFTLKVEHITPQATDPALRSAPFVNLSDRLSARKVARGELMIAACEDDGILSASDFAHAHTLRILYPTPDSIYIGDDAVRAEWEERKVLDAVVRLPLEEQLALGRMTKFAAAIAPRKLGVTTSAYLIQLRGWVRTADFLLGGDVNSRRRGFVFLPPTGDPWMGAGHDKLIENLVSFFPDGNESLLSSDALGNFSSALIADLKGNATTTQPKPAELNLALLATAEALQGEPFALKYNLTELLKFYEGSPSVIEDLKSSPLRTRIASRLTAARSAFPSVLEEIRKEGDRLDAEELTKYLPALDRAITLASGE